MEHLEPPVDETPKREAARPRIAAAERGPVRQVLIATVAALLVLLAIEAARSYRGLARGRQHRAALENELRDTEVRIESLERYIFDLENDPVLLERLAREELGLAAPGDIVIVLPEPAGDAEVSDGSHEPSAPQDERAPPIP